MLLYNIGLIKEEGAMQTTSYRHIFVKVLWSDVHKTICLHHSFSITVINNKRSK